ncbi:MULTISPECIES: hypothetical protein [Bacillus]|uniref:Uncharacterized protein n=1 Tax=Bacillus infantis NRRL B-14911 TaxID=1367477 RepID=U5LFS9_9BACI|nr:MULTISPECIES: hypothetical protein [Bacillus]AGX06310.1 hypothetical protein N288_22350 [Bacillus infantis NRRL B-14911]EAR68767.1 hypothetical protein B14911_04254 [Bacillus sp. NRRL B-14911]MCA1033655.1 hypothetical protein [Bacillus infantis]MDT0162098.1 hypothetical protein [Bacillus sp. AG4(2022)]
MRALTLAEIILIIYAMIMLFTSIFTLISEGWVALVFNLVEGKGAIFSGTLILIIIIDAWRVKKRRNLLQKGRLKPGQLF